MARPAILGGDRNGGSLSGPIVAPMANAAGRIQSQRRCSLRRTVSPSRAALVVLLAGVVGPLRPLQAGELSAAMAPPAKLAPANLAPANPAPVRLAQALAVPTALAGPVDGTGPDGDLRPGDWAYQALSQLGVRYSCLAADSRVVLDGATALNRYEAAALLQACLANIGERTDEIRRLELELQRELAVLKGRSDSLEARLGELQATQFSTNTILRADTRWWLGAVQYGGNQVDRASRTYDGRLLREALVLVYDVRFNVDTSFDGQDLLRIRLRSGNGGYSDFRSSTAPSLRVSGVSPSSCTPGRLCRNDLVLLDKLYYQRPIGDHLHVTAGSRVTQKDMLGIWPSVYGDNEVLLSTFDKGGAPGAYSDVKGSGVGLYWNQRARAATGPGLVLSGVYSAAEGKNGNPAEGGLFTAASRGAATAQLGYLGTGWGMAAVYTFNQAGAYDRAAITPLVAQTWPKSQSGLGGHVDSYGLSAFWQPQRSGWIPAINLGWGLSHNVYDHDGAYAASSLLSATSQSWMLGFNWSDAFDSGSELGMAIGSPQFMTRYTNPTGQQGADDQALMMEIWYRYQATDWLSITPGLFWLPRPRGQLSASGSTWDSTPLPSGHGSSFRALGALLKLRFRF